MAEEPKPELRRCPNCGASDLALNTELGKIQCRHCKGIFDGKLADDRSGADDLIDEEILVTFRCSSCGAEVTLNTEDTLSAQCHWCRHIFSLNEKILNGAVPDMVLPFSVKREEAIKKISARILSMPNDYYDADFMAQFDAENDVHGVYFPFFVMDEKAHMTFKGVGQRSIWGSMKGLSDKTLVQQAEIERDFDFLVDDLTIESSSKRLKQDSLINTNSVINAIQPFDVENAMDWDANYVRGFNCERRDTNVKDIDDVADLRVRDIARLQLRETISYYNRGVRWTEENVEVKDRKWKTAYLPVWLYSYKNEQTGRIYYMAVNGRTGEMSGVMPLRDKKLVREKVDTSAPIGAIAFGIAFTLFYALLLMMLGKVIWLSPFTLMGLMGLILIVSGTVALRRVLKGAGYKDVGAENIGIRHGYEQETNSEISNLKKRDFNEHEEQVDAGDSIEGRNDSTVYGTYGSASVNKIFNDNGGK